MFSTLRTRRQGHTSAAGNERRARVSLEALEGRMLLSDFQLGTLQGFQQAANFSCINNIGSVTGCPNNPQDRLYFRTQGMGTSEHYLRIQFGAGNDLDLYLYPYSGSTLLRSATQTGTVETMSLEGIQAGDYRMEVRPYQGARTFYNLSSQAPPPGGGGGTDFGDTLATAHNTQIAPTGGTFNVATQPLGNGSFGNRDVDLFRFEAAAGARLTAQTSRPSGSGTVDTVLRLFNASGQPLQLGDDCEGTVYSCLDFQLPAAGTYFVGVSGYPNLAYNPNAGGSGVAGATGNYGLTLTVAPGGGGGGDFGDTLATAEDTSITPAGGAFAVETQPLGNGPFTTRDVDLFRFEVDAGARVTARTRQPSGSGTVDTMLRLFDANGQQLQRSDDCDGTLYSCIDYQFTSAGTYYLGVSGYPNDTYNPNVGGSGVAGETGNYGLNMTVEPGMPPSSVAAFAVFADSEYVAVGEPINLYVVALDAAGEIVTNYTGEVSFSSSDPSAVLPRNYTFRIEDGGIAFFPGGAKLFTPGTQEITVADTATGTAVGTAYFMVGGESPHPGSGGRSLAHDTAVALALTQPGWSIPVVPEGEAAPSRVIEVRTTEEAGRATPAEQAGPAGSVAAVRRAVWESSLDFLGEDWTPWLSV